MDRGIAARTLPSPSTRRHIALAKPGGHSLVLKSATLKDVQEYMGHADIQMTANIYGHLDMQRKELLTQKMASSLF